ncbi:hypothetical protein AAVH_13230, partial [Aphelenchoides avenae]
KRTGALVKPSQDNKSVLLVGSSAATLAAKTIIEGLHLKRRQVPQAVKWWLTNPAKGAKRARALGLDHKFDTCISIGEARDDDPASLVDLAVVGELEKNVNDVLAIIDGLHVKHVQIPQAVYHWLINTSKGAQSAREVELERKFDTCIHVGRPSDDDPASLVDFAVVGEREQNLNDVLALIDGLHVKHVQIPQAVYYWLVTTSKGAECARALELERKFDTCVSLGGPIDDDLTSAVGLAIVGERKENVDQVFATIGIVGH